MGENIEELRQEAIRLAMKLTEEEAAEVIRILREEGII